MDIVSVKISETKKRLNIFDFLGLGPILNGFDLHGIYTQTSQTNNMAEILHGIHMKSTFLTVCEEVMFMKPLEDLRDMFDVILFVQGENKNIIQIDDNKTSKRSAKMVLRNL